MTEVHRERDTKPGRDKAVLMVDAELCKGCRLCMDVCKPQCIGASDKLNSYSYKPAYYLGSGCTGCGLCFYACPEPGAIRVERT